jgi:hypothetical protein
MERKKSIPCGISFPIRVIHKIDVARGDIPRSRYLLRLIEDAYNREKKEEESSTDHP